MVEPFIAVAQASDSTFGRLPEHPYDALLDIGVVIPEAQPTSPGGTSGLSIGVW